MSDQQPNTPPAGDNGGDGSKPWYAGITDPDLRGLAELKKWDSPDKALQSYKHLESHMGVPPERLLKLPEKPEDPGWAEIKSRLGFAAPETAEEYELPIPEGFNDDYAKAIAAKAKELGIPKHMLRGLSEHNNELVKSILDANEKADAQRQTDALAALRADWGGTFDTTMALAQRAEETVMRETGLSQESVDAWRAADPQGYYKLQAYFGSKMGEGRRIDGESAPTPQAMSPEAARTQLKSRMADPDWFSRWEKGGSEERTEWKRLNGILRDAG